MCFILARKEQSRSMRTHSWGNLEFESGRLSKVDGISSPNDVAPGIL